MNLDHDGDVEDDEVSLDLAHGHTVAQTHQSEFSMARADAARAEVGRTREMFNEALAAIGLGPFLASDDLSRKEVTVTAETYEVVARGRVSPALLSAMGGFEIVSVEHGLSRSCRIDSRSVPNAPSARASGRYEHRFGLD